MINELRKTIVEIYFPFLSVFGRVNPSLFGILLQDSIIRISESVSWKNIPIYDSLHLGEYFKYAHCHMTNTVRYCVSTAKLQIVFMLWWVIKVVQVLLGANILVASRYYHIEDRPTRVEPHSVFSHLCLK